MNRLLLLVCALSLSACAAQAPCAGPYEPVNVAVAEVPHV